MVYLKLMSIAVLATLFTAPVRSDFGIFAVYDDNNYCGGDDPHCVNDPMFEGFSAASPSGDSVSGNDVCPEANFATNGQNGGVANDPSTQELWWSDGICGSPAPYYCFMLNGQLTCNDNNGQNIANCSPDGSPAPSAQCAEPAPDAISSNWVGQYTCTGPISC